MIGFASRRWRNTILVVLAIAALGWLGKIHADSLTPGTFASGWLLLIVCLFLAAYNAKKKLPFLPTLKSSTWLQAHLYVGYFSIALFFMHVGLRGPHGPFLTLLYLLFCGVVASGLFGICISRLFPRRMSIRGEEVIFERIPQFRRRLNEQAEDLVVRAVSETDATTIAEFYRERLADFFAAPRNFWMHLVQSTRPRYLMIRDLGALDRYFNDREREFSRELITVIEAKDDLDFYYAHQATLKGWLFFHVACTYAMLLCAVLHVILVHAFSTTGGIH